MNLLEDFDRARNTLQDVGQYGDLRFDEAVPGDDLASPSTSYEHPQLAVEATVRQAARGRGQVVAAACAAETLLLTTSKGYLLRYHWDEFGNEKVQEVELTRQADARIQGVFVDPSGNHVIASIKAHNAWESHYLHKRWQKARVLNKLKGLAVSAVGWQKQASAGLEGSSDSLESSSGEGVVGSESGSLHLLQVDEHSKKEGAFALLLDLKDRRKAVCAVEQEVLPNGRRVVLLATPGALYVVAGGNSLESVFASYQAGAVLEPLMEVDVPSLHSQLTLSRGADPASLPTAFAWLVGGTICHGHLRLRQYAGVNGEEVGEAAEYVADMRQLRLNGDEEGTSPEEEPTCMVMSEYHYVLLYADKLTAVNQVSGKVVSEVPLTSAFNTPVIGSPLPDGLLSDGTALQLVTSEAVHEVSVRNEGRDMWRTYLEHQDYDNALKLATGAAQRDTVFTAMAEDAMAIGDYRAAATHYARVVGGRPPFEDIALALVEAADAEALQMFLATKLQVLGRQDRAQATMVAAWLTELYLDQINRALLEAAGNRTASEAHETQLREFLTSYVDILDVNTTTSLLATYGRLDELTHFAAARNDREGLLEFLMQRPDGAARALAVLRKPSVSAELAYKLAPALVSASPAETVDYWVSASPALDPRRLLPALAKFGEPSATESGREQAMRYISFAIDRLRCEDSAVHNLAVALLCSEANEGRLLEFLTRSRNAIGRPLYDAKYALWLARERGRPRACVKLQCELGLYEDAVELALEVDLELAKAVANSPEEEDEALRRKLWLCIARRVVQRGQRGASTNGVIKANGEQRSDVQQQEDQAESIRQAVEFVKEAGGLLKIEDVLPLFPDFVTIDAFKAAICDSLQRYSKQIDDLKKEMDEATDIAEAVRSDLKLLSRRTATLSTQEACARCGRAICEPPLNPLSLPSGGAIPRLYLFPTGLVFHGLCAAAEVVAFGGSNRAKKVKTLLKRLSKVEEGALVAPGGHGHVEEAVAVLTGELEEEIGAEDPWNGELSVRMVDMPLVGADESQHDRDSWRI